LAPRAIAVSQSAVPDPLEHDPVREGSPRWSGAQHGRMATSSGIGSMR